MLPAGMKIKVELPERIVLLPVLAAANVLKFVRMKPLL